MTPEETARVLAKCAAFDRRTVGRADILAWHEVLSDLPVEDALQAVTAWYRERTEWVMPASVRSLALEVADQRRRVELRARIEAERIAIEAVPTEDRSAAVKALLAEVRDALPSVDPTKYRRAEWLDTDRRRTRGPATPNPHFDPAAAARLALTDERPTP
jgi:hypothetical protein